MVKVYTIGMMEHNAKNDPTVVAAEEMLNGSIFAINGEHKAVAPSGSDAELYIALNEFGGDDHARSDLKIPAGAYLNAYELKAWDGMYLEVSQDNLEDKIDTLAIGDTLGAHTNCKFKKGATSAVTFKVVEKILLGFTAGVRVQIVVG